MIASRRGSLTVLLYSARLCRPSGELFATVASTVSGLRLPGFVGPLLSALSTATLLCLLGLNLDQQLRQRGIPLATHCTFGVRSPSLVRPNAMSPISRAIFGCSRIIALSTGTLMISL